MKLLPYNLPITKYDGRTGARHFLTRSEYSIKQFFYQAVWPITNPEEFLPDEYPNDEFSTQTTPYRQTNCPDEPRLVAGDGFRRQFGHGNRQI